MFQFNEDQKDLRDLVRDFSEKELKPRAAELDKTSAYPKAAIEQLAEMGIMSVNIPEEYDGAGMDEVCKVLAIEEISRCCGSTAEIVATQLLVNDIIKKNGNEEQKQKYLPLSAQGIIGAFALTEPGAGSDAGGLRTRAVKKGDKYILNGSKCFISNMSQEEGAYAIVITLTDPEKGSRGGMTAFLVDRDAPGFSVGKTEEKHGIHAAAVSELVFDDCEVPESAIMGKVGDGFKIAMSGLEGGRVGMAGFSVGLAQAALEEAIKYTKEREQFKKPIAANQGIQWYLADMATRVEAARLLTYRAASALDDHLDGIAIMASMAKYYASETATYVADLALQMHGGYGYVTDYAIERIYRDARIARIFEGTSEIQKIVIAKGLLK